MPQFETAPRLAAMQARFATALRDNADAVPAEVTSHNASSPLKRFHIYRNNVYASLIAVLRGRFPVTERLVGEDFFRAMARLFVEQHPPRSPALLEYGAAFPPFIAAFEPAGGLPYLPDVAQLEWLRSEAYHAADAHALLPDALGAVAEQDLAGLRLRVHPSARLFRSAWPAVSIWEVNQDGADFAALAEDAGPEDALILRPQLEVLVVRLGPGGFAFAQSLCQGATLGEAAERAATDAEAFSLPPVLGVLLAAGAFSGISLTPEAASTP
jgi:hypothetical protein